MEILSQVLQQLTSLIPKFIDWFGALFTHDEWAAMAWLVGVTMAGTQTGKVLWRALPVRGGNDPVVINLMSSAIGFVCAYPVWPHGNSKWYIAGMIAGPMSILVFKMTFAGLHVFLPSFAAALNADRRSDPNPIPPANTPPRRAADFKAPEVPQQPQPGDTQK